MEELNIFIKSKKQELDDLEYSIGKLACNNFLHSDKYDEAISLISKFKSIKIEYDVLVELEQTIENNSK